MPEKYTWTNHAIELKKKGFTWKEIAKEIHLNYGVGRSAIDIVDLVRGQVRRNTDKEIKNSDSNQSDLSDLTFTDIVMSQSYGADGTLEQVKKCVVEHGEKLTPDRVLELHGLNPDEWEVLSYTNNNWQTVNKKDGSALDLFQSKVKARPNKQGKTLLEIQQHFYEMQTTHQYAPVKYSYSANKRRKMVEINLADLHFGKLSWHGDTGKDYDHKIATQICKTAIEEICSEITRYDIDYITFVWTNDFFNSDTITNTTTAGTQQDVDCRWQKMFNAGCDLLVWIVEQLRTIAPVKTMYTSSNHDQMTSYYAIRYLYAWFREDACVVVDSDASPRKYMAYGNTLIGFGHGDKEGKESTSKDKASRLASCMPIEAPKLWGETKIHEFHAAHLHSEQMIQEINGVLVRRISSPTASDTWHSESGWLGAIRKIQTFVWDAEYGNEAIINTFVKENENGIV